MRILLVEDDALVASAIMAGLRLHGMTVDHASDAATARSSLDSGHFDSVVLDLGLPDQDGMQLLARLRQGGHALPVLILSARDAVEHRVAGLQAGADDYLLKPFDLQELVARLHVLQRRVAGRSTNLIRHGALCFDADSRQVTLQGKPVELSRRELALLALLLNNPNRVVTPEQVKDTLYGFDDVVESNAVTVHIHHLRRKLGSGIVKTLRGIGYRLGEAEA